MYLTVQDYVKIFEPAGDKSREERRRISVDAHDAFREYYPKKLIYLPKLTADKIETINLELIRTFNTFSWSVDRQPNNSNSDKWEEIFSKMGGEILETLQELEDEFRKLLGDKS